MFIDIKMSNSYKTTHKLLIQNIQRALTSIDIVSFTYSYLGLLTIIDSQSRHITHTLTYAH